MRKKAKIKPEEKVHAAQYYNVENMQRNKTKI
jgi:hypothetical protein